MASHNAAMYFATWAAPLAMVTFMGKSFFLIKIMSNLTTLHYFNNKVTVSMCVCLYDSPLQFSFS